MIPPIEEFRIIAGKILKGEASAAEKEAFWKYMDQQEDEQVKVALFLEDVLGNLPDTAAPIETENRILDEILASPVDTPVVEMPAVRKTAIGLRYVAAAACVIALAGIVKLYFKMNTGAAPLAAIQWDTIINKQPNPRQVILADQTAVWLNKNAVLLVDKNYPGNRLVKLNGEAYFDVKSNVEKPFRVQTGAVTTTVLGTTFNIACVDSAYQVSLISGKVKVSKEDAGTENSIVLLPGETAFAGTVSTALNKTTTSVKDIAAWTHGDLVFNQESLQQALHKISEKYHVDIDIAPALLKGKQVSGVYPYAQSCEQVLMQVLFIYQLHYRKLNDGHILISS